MNELKQVIDESGLTDEEVARLLDVSVPTVERWKSAKTAPHKHLRKIIKDTLRSVGQEK